MNDKIFEEERIRLNKVIKVINEKIENADISFKKQQKIS